MKKLVSILLTICSLGMLCSVTGFAADTAVNDSALSITLQVGNPMMTVNGAEEEIDPGRDIAPVIVNEHTLMPVRAIVEKMGGSVTWDGNTQTVGLTYNGNEIQLNINSTTAYLNGAAQTLETAPVVINDRTMLPIRFIAESFGFDVSWDDANQLVTITNTPQDDIASVLEAGIVTSRDDLTFPVGDAVSGAFTGTAYLTPMINNDETYHFPQTNNVTFEPGARSYWHSHGGMIMIGTGGVGYYQEEGQPVQIIRKGDVVECPEGVKHWHGGSADTSFAHIAVNTNPELTGLEWFDRISDEEYDSLAELITE